VIKRGKCARIMGALAASAVLLVSYCGVAEAAWYKGQLHVHISGSGDDGAFSNAFSAASTYKRAGYHFMSITGHNVIHNVGQYNTDGTFVTMNGVELHNYSGTWMVDNPGWTHVNSINCNGLGAVDTSSIKTLQDQINFANAMGGISQVNHPSWQGFGENQGIGVLTTERLLATNNATLLEVKTAYDETMWDAYLSTGRQIFATLTDDNHTATAGYRMVVVQAPSLTRSNIVDALKSGSFYAANDNSSLISSIIQSGRTLSVVSSGTRVVFIGRNGAVLQTVNSGSASYELPADGLYVRAKVYGSGSSYALTQAYFPTVPEPSGMAVSMLGFVGLAGARSRGKAGCERSRPWLLCGRCEVSGGVLGER